MNAETLFKKGDMVNVSPDADFSHGHRVYFQKTAFIARVGFDQLAHARWIDIEAVDSDGNITHEEAFDLVSPEYVTRIEAPAAPVSTDAAKAKAYDALVAQLGGMTQEWQANYLRNVSDQTDNMYTHGYRFGKQDAASQVRAVLMHAQLVADEPPVSDDPEVETRKFETVDDVALIEAEWDTTGHEETEQRFREFLEGKEVTE